MLHSHKLILNTFALYLKIIINTLVTLFATKIALTSLGINEYGLYNLIAGVIVLLSFLNGALTISTQRFLSIAIGEKNQHKLASIFNVSLVIHVVIALFIGITLVAIQPLLFGGFLNINSNLINTAIVVYNIMIISAMVTIIGIPFSAIINAHEDMVFFSISEIISSLIRFSAAIALLYISNNLLITYTWLMFSAIMGGFIIQYIWCIIKYKESKIKILLMQNKPLYREMLGFVSWNTLGSISVLVRNQGVAVILNIFFGTVVNAAYGIANQVNSLVLTFGSTLTTVFTPSIIQAKGSGNEAKMLSSALLSSKLSFLLSSVIALPVILFMPQILQIWLNTIPEYSISFCSLIIITFIIMQLYPGINRAIYAAGKIKGYQISISLILMSNIPIGVTLFKLNFPAYSIIITMIFIQFLTLIATVYYAHKYISLNVKAFFMRYIIPAIILFSCYYLIGYFINLCTELQHTQYLEIILFSLIYSFTYSTVYYVFIFNKSEKHILHNLLFSIHKIILK